MNREEAKDRFWADGSKTHNHNEIIDIVFDDIDSKTCDNCKLKPKEGENYSFECGECSRFYGDKFERKPNE
jgi:hypothetical protein